MTSFFVTVIFSLTWWKIKILLDGHKLNNVNK